MVFEGNDVKVIEINGEPMFEIYSTGMALGFETSSKGKVYPHKIRINKVLKNAEISTLEYNGQTFMNITGLKKMVSMCHSKNKVGFINWLKENNIPLAPVYQMYYQKGDKSRIIKGRVDIFVDDSPSNFIQINKAGIPCLLMDSPYNQNFKTDLRITDLTYQNILNKYNEFFRKL